jgi:hypothetical protein
MNIIQTPLNIYHFQINLQKKQIISHLQANNTIQNSISRYCKYYIKDFCLSSLPTYPEFITKARPLRKKKIKLSKLIELHQDQDVLKCFVKTANTQKKSINQTNVISSF